MKLSTLYQYEVLCEDAQTSMFVRGILQDQQIHTHRIRIVTATSGEGSAEAFVRAEYPKRLKALRQFNYNRRALIVCIDADINEVEDRKKQLASECSNLNPAMKDRQLDEPVIIWVPKRNIETWIRFFRDDCFHNTVNEKTNYKTMNRVSCKAEAGRMSAFLQTDDDERALPSLKDAKDEYIKVCGRMQ